MFKIAEYFTEEERRAAAEADYQPHGWQGRRLNQLPTGLYCPLGVMFKHRGGGIPRWWALYEPMPDTVADELVDDPKEQIYEGQRWRAIRRQAAHFITRWDHCAIRDLHAALGVKRVRDR